MNANGVAMACRRGKKAKNKNRVGLSREDEYKLRKKMRGNDDYGIPVAYSSSACSEPWVDAQFASFDDTDQDGDPITYRFHIPNAFPPRELGQTAEQSKMRKCRECGRYSPSLHGVMNLRQVCDDCCGEQDSEIIREMHAADILVPPRSHPSARTFS